MAEYVVIRRGGGCGTFLFVIAAVLAFGLYALIPVGLTSLLIALALWKVLPRLPGMPKVAFMNALVASFMMIGGYVVATLLVRLVFPVAPSLGLPFGMNPLTQRILWVRQQFMLSWPQEILYYITGIGHRGALTTLLGEIPGILVAGLLLMFGFPDEEVFTGWRGYWLACGVAAVSLLVFFWIGMRVELMTMPALLGESFRLF